MERKSTSIPVLALGKSAILVAQKLKAQMGNLMDLYLVSETTEEALPFIFPHEQPWRFLIYNCAEVEPHTVKRFGTAVKVGGSVIGIEIASHEEASRASWQSGTDMLIRTDSERTCLKAAAFLLRMAFSHQNALDIDLTDALSLFSGTDCARIGMAAETGELAKSHAITNALWNIGWPLSTLRGLLLNIAGSEDRIHSMDMERFMNAVMDKMPENGNMVWSVSIDPALGDTIRVTAIATQGWKRNGKDACEWIGQFAEVGFHDNEEG